MPRVKDIAWKFAIRLEGEKWRCPYCENEYLGKVTRVKSHLLQIPNRGISFCTKVPEYIRELMRWLLPNQVQDKDNIAWKFVNKLEDNKWRCYQCNEDFFGDLSGVKGHLLKVPNAGISICTKVPDHVGTLMWSLLDERAEEESGQAVPLTPLSELVAGLLKEPDETTREGESVPRPTMALAEAEPGSHLHDMPDQPQQYSLPSQMQINDQQIPSEASSFQSDQLPDVGNSNCLQKCHPHSQSQIPMDIDPSIASQPTSGSHISEAPNLELPVLDAVTNAVGPSGACRASLHIPRMRKGATPGASSSFQHDQLRDTGTDSMGIHPPTASQPPRGPHYFNATRLHPQVLAAGANFAGPSSSQGNYFRKNKALKRKIDRLYSRAHDIKEELKYGTSLSLKKPRREVTNWLADVEEFVQAVSEEAPQQMDEIMREAEDLMRDGDFRGELFEVGENRVSKLIEGKMVGEAFQRNTKMVLEYLVGNQICRLGIYGMGGVGKTTLMKHVYNRLSEKANQSSVFWVTVSQDFDTKMLQDKIYEAIGSRKPQEEDVRKRAKMLYDYLAEKGKCTLILDNVWEYFDLEDVGIPVKEDGLKLVLTTRDISVCYRMQCQEEIKIETLSPKEAENLFIEEYGSKVKLNSETKAILKSVVEECAGLPLGVITMARSMRGMTNLFEWEDSLEKLKESDMGESDMEGKVFMNLKFSYDRLGKHEVQMCFLSCALYPEDQGIDWRELIEFYIDQGLFDGLGTRSKQYNRGLTILTNLVNVCLLENHGAKVKMHDLIRDMALHIMEATSLVKAGRRLTTIPPMECWTNTLEKASLMENRIKEFPSDMSPNCPKLSIILLNGSLSYGVVIPNSFFKYLRQLKVLNLSGCGLRELPSSISFLVNLRALLLTKCSELRHIPHLGELTSLRKLDVAFCDKLEALNGLEMLVNLRFLEFRGTKIEILPEGILGRLEKLQRLSINFIHAEHFASVWQLEHIFCDFKGADDFNKFVRFASQKISSRYYQLRTRLGLFCALVNDEARLGRSVMIDQTRDAIMSVKRDSTEELTLILGKTTDDYTLIPHDVDNLILRQHNSSITDLSGMYPLENLEHLCIEYWGKLRVLSGGLDKDVIDGPDSHAPPTAPLLFPSFPSLRELKIRGCENLKYLFGHGSKFVLPHLGSIEIFGCQEMLGITVATAPPPPPHSSLAFPSLTVITVFNCDEMKRVVEPEWLPHFPKLSCINVSNCDEMEELIGGPPPYTPVEEMSFECLTEQDGLDMRSLFEDEAMMARLHHTQLWRFGFSLENLKYYRVQVVQGQEGSINNAPSSSQSSISLPKLRFLQLDRLARLKSICEAPVLYDSMNVLGVDECPGLSFATAVTQ